MPDNAYFITGTDTHVGKTYIATGLIKIFHQKGYKTLGCKPLSSGCSIIDEARQNADAVSLQLAASVNLPLEQINSIALCARIAPHIAAKLENTELTSNKIIASCNLILNQQAEKYVIEGVGGWLVPINQQETMADVAIALDLKVILVVGMRLGCLNHALLTARVMENQNIKLAGWVANCLDPDMGFLQENIDTLKHWLPAPLIGIVPFGLAAENYLKIELL